MTNKNKILTKINYYTSQLNECLEEAKGEGLKLMLITAPDANEEVERISNIQDKSFEIQNNI